MKEPNWTEGGATVPTVVATLISLLAAPIGGLGVLLMFFGAWVPAISFGVAGIAMWVTGRRLLDR